MEKIKFIENDESGESTLDVISQANKFNVWMYKTIQPYCSGNVLEIGSGIGNISQYFLQNNYRITLTDIREGYCVRLKQKFNGNPNLSGVEQLDLLDQDLDKKYFMHFDKYDTIFALNVIEHIYDDTLALKNCNKFLTRGGKIIILVPSYQCLFSRFDRELGHYRRYTKKTLSEVFISSGYNIIHKQYFNMVGIFGWYFSGKILKKKVIPSGQMSLYNNLVPLFKIIDKIFFNSMGLSTIIVGEKI